MEQNVVIRDPHLDEIFQKAGGRAALARKLSVFPGQKKINRSAVSQWLRVPDDRVQAVHLITGVPLKRVRSDLYDPDVRKALAQEAERVAAA